MITINTRHKSISGPNRFEMSHPILPGLVAFLFLLLLAPPGHAYFNGAIVVDRHFEPHGVMEFGTAASDKFSTYQVAGAKTELIYALPEGRSRAQLFEELKQSLVVDGYHLKAGHKEQPEYQIEERHYTRAVDFQGTQYLQETRDSYELKEIPDQSGGYYLSALKHDIDKDVYLVATFSNARNYAHLTMVEVAHRVPHAAPAPPTVETQVSVTEEETVTAAGSTTRTVRTMVLTKERIQVEIQNNGFIDIHGIEFDIDSATIKPMSWSALDAMGQYLQIAPQYSYYVVGHTSDTGTFEHNMKLSLARANSVIQALVERYGVNPARLTGYGVGPVAPIESNYSDLGRAHNRRVVLIRRLPSQFQ